MMRFRLKVQIRHSNQVEFEDYFRNKFASNGWDISIVESNKDFAIIMLRGINNCSMILNSGVDVVEYPPENSIRLKNISTNVHDTWTDLATTAMPTSSKLPADKIISSTMTSNLIVVLLILILISLISLAIYVTLIKYNICGINFIN